MFPHRISASGLASLPSRLADLPTCCANRSQIADGPTGVKSYDVSLETQSADIVTESILDYDTVLEKIKKTGKKVNSGEADGEGREV